MKNEFTSLVLKAWHSGAWHHSTRWERRELTPREELQVHLNLKGFSPQAW